MMGLIRGFLGAVGLVGGCVAGASGLVTLALDVRRGVAFSGEPLNGTQWNLVSVLAAKLAEATQIRASIATEEEERKARLVDCARCGGCGEVDRADITDEDVARAMRAYSEAVEALRVAKAQAAAAREKMKAEGFGAADGCGDAGYTDVPSNPSNPPGRES